MKAFRLAASLLLVFFYFTSQGQHRAFGADYASVEIQGSKYIMGDHVYRANDAINKMAELDLEAYRLANSAKSNADAFHILAFMGSYLMVWGLISDDKGGTNWSPATAGATTIAFSLPFNFMARKKRKKAISMYNHSVSETLAGLKTR